MNFVLRVLRKTLFIFIIFGLAIGGLFLFFQNSDGYDDKTTHPGLTDEIVDFYNLSFDDELSLKEKEWIVQGSIDEDIPPRWINHFFDPANGDGWKAENLGDIPPLTLQIFSKIFLNANTEIVSSKNWVHNEILQLRYADYGGNRTWENAIRRYVNGDREYAYKTLGHILHLLEDKTVPEHTRNDTHAHEGSILTKDGGSPYEDYSSNYTRKNLTTADNLKNENKLPIILNSIDEYFDYLANYSNKYFFSEHTINSSKYENPKILREALIKDILIGYGKNKNGEELPLAKIEISYDNDLGEIKSYSLRDKDKYILENDFSHLSREAVMSGAGVIKLFKQEVEKAEKDKSLITEEPKISWWQKMISPGYGIIIPVYNTAVLALNNAQNFISGIFQNTNSNELSANLSGQIFPNQQPVQYGGFQSLENQVSQANQIIEQPAIQSLTPVNENQTAIINQTAERQRLLAEIQARLDLIKIQAEELAQQEKQNQILYSGSGGGGGGASPTIAEPAPSVNEPQNLSTAENNSASTTNLTAIINDSKETFTTNFVSAISHIVISEIQAGANENPDNEFVELYNPADQSVDLTNWSLKRKTSPNATSTKNLVLSFPTSTIPAKSFFLIGHKDYSGIAIPDLIYSNNSNPLVYKDDIAILQDSDGLVIDEINYLEIPKDKSLERKAFINNQCATASNSNEFLGNGCDTDNSDDWEIRDNPNPQNSSSLPEPRNASTIPKNFQIVYNASTTEMKFNWQESWDYGGATSTITYKIIDISNTSSTFSDTETSATSTSFSINEVGRDYNFSIQAFDKEGLGSGIATATISIPGFLSNLYFYKDYRPNSNDYLIETFYSQYPFVPDVYQNGNNVSWKAMIFYLNSEPAKEIYLDPGFSQWYPWPSETIDKILKIKYNACASGNISSYSYILILPDIKENCSVWGGLRNISANYNFEDKNFSVAAVSSTIETAFSSNDYLTVAYYSFYSSGWWKGLPEVFQLAAIDKTKYYFGKEPVYQPPTAPNNLTATPDGDYSNLIINWENSTDPDSMDNLIRYELNYALAGQPLDENNWQESVKSFYRTNEKDENGNDIFIQVGPSIPINSDNSYDIYLRAKDEFGNTATSIISWSSPAVLQ